MSEEEKVDYLDVDEKPEFIFDCKFCQPIFVYSKGDQVTVRGFILYLYFN